MRVKLTDVCVWPADDDQARLSIYAATSLIVPGWVRDALVMVIELGDRHGVVRCDGSKWSWCVHRLLARLKAAREVH